MVTQGTDELKAQIAHLERMAESGQSIPLQSGAIFILWGLLVALAGFLAHLAIILNADSAVIIIWVTVMVAGWPLKLLVERRLGLKARDGSASYGNEVTRTVWAVAGLTIIGYLFLASLSEVPGENIPVVALLMSGLALVASAAATQMRLLYISGIGIILTGLANEYWQFGPNMINLVVSIAAVMFIVVPGIFLIMRSRKEP